MSQTERSGPPPHEPPAGTTTASVAPGTDIERARRRLRLHHLLVRRRRWSDELDELLLDGFDAEDLDAELADYWHDIGMTMGYAERRRAGMALTRWAA